MNPCPVCHEPLEVGWDACPACGTPVCTSCQRALKPHWRHCPHCKTPTYAGGATPSGEPPSGVTPSGASPLPGAPRSLATGQPAPFTVLGAAPTTGPLPDVPNGTLLADRYRVEAKLGVGGHGTVYRAIDTLLHDRPLALKLLAVTHHSAFAGIVREYHARKRIRSFEHVLMADQPMVARYLDHEIILYPMDLADGGNLRDQIPALNAIKDPAGRQDAVLDLFRQMCQGVQACHEAGITHLDLKPENFLLHEGRVKVTDFGIARVLGAPIDARDGLGTGPYMAPEQHLAANPDDVDNRADIYALGIILYELLAGGKRPYEGGDLHRKKRELRPKRLDVSVTLQRLLERTIADDPDARYVDARAVQADLPETTGRAELTAASQPATRDTVRNGVTAPVRILTESDSPVIEIAFNPDGTILAGASSSGVVRLWDPHSGLQMRALIGHTAVASSIAFSPDGTVLATASRDQTIRIWDPSTGACRRILTGHMGPVVAVAFSPDGSTLASGSHGRNVRLWNPYSGNLRDTLEEHTNSATVVAYSPDGTTLVTCSYGDETIRLWNPDTGQQLRALLGHTEAVMAVAFSPDGNTLASASLDNTIRIWNPHTGKCRVALETHAESTLAVAFSPDGNTLASASLETTIRIWNPHTGNCQRVLTGHTGSVNAVAFSPEGATLASGSADHTVRIWSS